MILIMSSTSDSSTIEVANWLEYYGVTNKVIYPKDLLQNVNLLDFSKNSILKYLEGTISSKLSDVSVVWCRKWPVNRLYNSVNPELSEKNNERLNKATIEEIRVLSDLFLDVFPKEKVINHFNNFKISKLQQLLIARKTGLKVPRTHIVSSKSSLETAVNLSSTNIIAKAMKESIGLSDDNKSFSSYTSRVIPEEISSQTFMPSLIQEEVKKQYEVRSFVIGDRFFSMAIFSQGNKQTEVDFRVYDRTRPNKVARYSLPTEIKCKVREMMKELDLKTGSIDFIVDQNNDHYFLEINPYGQFGMVSKPNRYNIEQVVAKYLIEYEVHKKTR